ncbi:MAG TPA: flagellar basal body P-ring formation chaperone FlgA [Rhodocyclaceae bacterium]|nr:flagellar basal body P-ring formation chaperone FlgA [Rhodocyclaceae bacterium]
MLNQPIRRLLIALLVLTSLAAHAQDDVQAIRTAIENYLRGQTSGLPGQASFTVSPLEGANGRPPCPSFDISMAPGARSIGRSTVLVRCRNASNWAIYVPVQIKVVTEYIVTTRPLNQGQLIGESDLTTQSGDLGNLPNGVLLDASQALGRIAAIPIPAGKPLLTDLLRQPPVIQAGQTVKVVSRGPTFEVSNEGRALTAAADGKVVQVRLNNGQVVSGLARQGGIVEISF